MRVFTATLGTETNTFSPLPTGLENFLETLHWPPGSHPAFPTEVTAPLWAARERRDRDGWAALVLDDAREDAAPMRHRSVF